MFSTNRDWCGDSGYKTVDSRERERERERKERGEEKAKTNEGDKGVSEFGCRGREKERREGRRKGN